MKFCAVIFIMLWAICVQAAETMQVDGRRLYTAAGEQVVLRGVNEMIVWIEEEERAAVFEEIARSGANCVRIVWTMEGPLDEMEEAIEYCLDNRMIPMIELHDATGRIEMVRDIVEFWIRPDVVEILKRHRKWLLVNIANEAGDSSVTKEMFLSVYEDAIRSMREAGIEAPLIVDAPDWGKDENMVLETWRELRDCDPLSNLMFSVHTYWVEEPQTRLDRLIGQVVADEIPFLFGEGPQEYGYDCESVFPWRELIAACQKFEIGWIPWSWGWMENGDCPDKFDITTDGIFGNWKTDWGEGVVVGDPNSIANTSSRPASLLAR